MARVTRIEYIDDFDGKPISDGDGEAVEFSLDGTSYTIDLSSANAATFRGLVKPYVTKATKVARSSGRRKRSGSSSSSDINAIREWARANGHDVGDRGRIKAEIVEAYRRTVS